MNVSLTLEVPEEAVPILTSLATLLRSTSPPASVEPLKPSQVVDAIIDQYKNHPNAQHAMAQAASSRSRDWVLRHRGDWPLKAIYFLTMNQLKPNLYGHPREFHSSEARSYFESLGFAVVPSLEEVNI